MAHLHSDDLFCDEPRREEGCPCCHSEDDCPCEFDFDGYCKEHEL